MSFWQIILLLSAGQGILLSLALISSIRKRYWQNVFLGLFLITISLELLNIWRISTGQFGGENAFPYWNLESYLIIPPAIFLFSRIVTQPHFKVESWHFLLFLPALIEIISAFFYNYVLYPRIEFRLIDQWWWVWPTQIIPVFLIAAVLAVFAYDILRLKRLINDRGIGLPDAHILKVTIFFGVLCSFTILWILEAFFLLPVLDITLGILCALLYAISYLAIINSDFFKLPSYLTKTIKATRPKQKDQEGISAIDNAFIKQKLYLKPGLTVKDAAAQLAMPSRQLSILINNYYHVDFRNYLNDLRIKEVIRKVEVGEAKYKTLLAIALESGFSSKSTFNKAFKDQTGKSPSNYFRQD